MKPIRKKPVIPVLKHRCIFYVRMSLLRCGKKFLRNFELSTECEDDSKYSRMNGLIFHTLKPFFPYFNQNSKSLSCIFGLQKRNIKKLHDISKIENEH